MFSRAKFHQTNHFLNTTGVSANAATANDGKHMYFPDADREKSSDEVCAVYDRARDICKKIDQAQEASPPPPAAAAVHAAQHQVYQHSLDDATKELETLKTETGCTGVLVPVKLSYPGIQISSLHTAMLGSLVMLIKLVSTKHTKFSVAKTPQ